MRGNLRRLQPERLEEIVETLAGVRGPERLHAFRKGELDVIRNQLDEISVSTATLQSQIAALEASVESIQASLAVLSGNISDLEGETAGLDSTITTLQGTVADLQSDVANIEDPAAIYTSIAAGPIVPGTSFQDLCTLTFNASEAGRDLVMRGHFRAASTETGANAPTVEIEHNGAQAEVITLDGTFTTDAQILIGAIAATASGLNTVKIRAAAPVSGPEFSDMALWVIEQGGT